MRNLKKLSLMALLGVSSLTLQAQVTAEHLRVLPSRCITTCRMKSKLHNPYLML